MSCQYGYGIFSWTYGVPDLNDNAYKHLEHNLKLDIIFIFIFLLNNAVKRYSRIRIATVLINYFESISITNGNFNRVFHFSLSRPIIFECWA